MTAYCVLVFMSGRSPNLFAAREMACFHTAKTRSRHRAEAFQIEAQAGPGSGIPPAKMSQRVSLSDGEGLLPSLCSDEPRAERTDQRVRQRSTHRVRDFVFARFAERPVFAGPTVTSCRIKQKSDILDRS